MYKKVTCECEIHNSITPSDKKAGLIGLLAIVALFLIASMLDTQYLAITGAY